MPYVKRFDLHCSSRGANTTCYQKSKGFFSFFSVIEVEDKPWVADKYGLNIYLDDKRYIIEGNRTHNYTSIFSVTQTDMPPVIIDIGFVVGKNHIKREGYTHLERKGISDSKFIALSTSDDMHEQAIDCVRKAIRRLVFK